MQAISVRQPWAAMIAAGIKTIETRKWGTGYRGDIVIISSKRPVFKGLVCRCQSCFFFGTADDFDVVGADKDKLFCRQCGMATRARIIDASAAGMTLCVARMADCRPMTIADEKAACCGSYPGATAWVFENIRPMKPAAVRGQLGIFDDEIPGVCRMCGCTDLYACPGGCSWADEKHTICSACAGERDK